MAFNSYPFIFGFLPATVAGFWLLARFAGRSAALGWLILASVAFYAYASLIGLAIIVPSIAADYLIARTMMRIHPSGERLRRILFIAGVAGNVLLLGYFKYRNFFLDTVNTVFATHFELTKLLLPLGISFLTFQKIAFLADVQSGQVKVVRFFDFLLFMLFFPRAVAGPIVHYEEVMPQLTGTTLRNIRTNLAVGVCLFSVGIFKKTVIADGVAQFVFATFDPPTGLSGQPLNLPTAWTGVLAYTFQLYFDFSGYSDMALGLARMFGVRLPMNFNSPLKASSIVEFWSRWHITLTRFLTAYIYTPIVLRVTRARMAKGKPVLRGKRSSLLAIAVLIALPTLITMAISGFWHGVGWQFIVWGVLHGIYLTINQGWRTLRPRFWPDQSSYECVMRPLGFVLTFGAVVTAFVFFRATSVTSALLILRGMVGMNGIQPHQVQLLQQVGIHLHWNAVMLFQPIAPFVWIVVLFLGVVLFPNSLELLRRFQPALDFPRDLGEASRSEVALPMAVQQPRGAKAPSAAARLHATWVAVAQLGREGIPLSRLTGAIAALLSVLAIMAVNRGSKFIYGQF
jgi:alginate O-acetyltransferase complex protein AlgI